MAFFRCIGGGGNTITIDGQGYDGDLDLLSKKVDNVEMDMQPYSFGGGSAVVLDGEIHILGGNGNASAHYKYSNGVWVSVSTLPYTFYYGMLLYWMEKFISWAEVLPHKNITNIVMGHGLMLVQYRVASDIQVPLYWTTKFIY